MSKLNLTIEQIEQLQPTEIATNPQVRNKFIQIYEAMWTPTTGVSGEAAYERELRNFNRQLRENQALRDKATKFSLFTAFLDIAISGLTLDSGSRAQAYLSGRNVCVGSDERGTKQYEGQCVLTVSGYGELLLRARYGQIRHADNPVIVYAEDEFEYGERNRQKFVNYTCKLPHTSNQITACFMKITRADGSIDYAVMLPEDWSRLSEYSSKQNAKWNPQTRQREAGTANELYTANNGQIDTGFLIAKCIKHGFKTYPKARVGRATQLESQQVDDFEIDDLYGVDTDTGEITTQDTGFAQPQDTSAGVVVIDASEDDVF